MRTNLTAAIAWRYLRSKKSHGAVGTISTVSVCAMAVATAAIICVLSVFNGFRQVIGARLDSLCPDVMVTPAQGKAFAQADSVAARIAALPEVELATPTLADNALAISGGKEMPVKLKGVIPEEYARVTAIKSIIPTDFGGYLPPGTDAAGGNPLPSVFAIGTASRLSVYPGTGALIFAPRRKGRVNLANPAASFLSDSVTCSGVYRSEQAQFDDDGLIIPLDAARRLLMYANGEASALEVRLREGVTPEEGAEAIGRALGNSFVAKDRLRQQEMNFRMVAIEKWVSFLLLVFILLIACFNIISALSMLVLEKEEGIGTLSAMGLSRRRIGAVFAWESIYVSGIGGLCGIGAGIILCLLQQHFGFIKLGGDPQASIIAAYPVELRAVDILATFGVVALLGLITAAITATFARSKVTNTCKI